MRSRIYTKLHIQLGVNIMRKYAIKDKIIIENVIKIYTAAW